MANLLSNNKGKSEGPCVKKMLDEIAALGYERPTIDLLHHTSTPLSTSVVEIIIKWLPSIYREHIGSGEHLVRALINTQDHFNPELLKDLYENSALNEGLKQTIAHVISISKVGDVSGYVRKSLLNKPVSHASAGFLSALTSNCNFSTRDELMEFLKLIFFKFSYYEEVFRLFQRYGRMIDIPFLKACINDNNHNLKFSKSLVKVIEAIQNRKIEPAFPKKNHS